MSKVYIDPACRLLYASYYIEGIKEYFGSENIHFDLNHFEDLKYDKSSYDQFFAFVIFLENNQLIRLVIDFHDGSKINNNALIWSNVYGKVNYNSLNIPDEAKHKIIPIAPGFATKLYRNRIKGLLIGGLNYFVARKNIKVPFSNFMSGYLARKRYSLKDYYPSLYSESDYIFFVSTLWKHETCKEYTNVWRGRYIKTCKKINDDLNFEGGFYCRAIDDEALKYEDCLIDTPYQFNDYIKKLAKSCVVFNTPAVHLCHGWKFAEYMLLGKAVISTPLKNVLPKELEHGKNVHFVNNESELIEAIDKIRNDHTYRKQLEYGALTYYNEYLRPYNTVKELIFQYKQIYDKA